MQNTVKVRGLDASVWQGNINWEQVADSGISFAMLRASYGMETDRNFETNIRGAQRAGIDCGAYHYSKADNEEEAVAEADFFLNTIKGYQLPYPVALDIESITKSQENEANVTRVVRAFCERVQEAGYYVSVYCDLYWIDNLISAEIFNDFDLWLAEWTSNPTYGRGFGMWQYTGDGKIMGINSNVDLDFAYKDYPAIIKENGLNGFGEEEDQSHFLYIVKRGDTLWNLAQRFGTTYEEIAELNNIRAPYILDVGDVLKIPQENAQPASASVIPTVADNDLDFIDYTVRDGDSLWEIGRKFDVDYMAIARANGIEDLAQLSVGQVLRIPVDIDEINDDDNNEYTVYTVKSGDTIWKIAAAYGIDYRDLAEFNRLRSPDDLKVGQRIRIPLENDRFEVGDKVRILPDAEYYYAGRKIPDWVKNDYTYYITATEYNSMPVILGGKPSVLLGRRRNNMTGEVEDSVNIWANTDILQKADD